MELEGCSEKSSYAAFGFRTNIQSEMRTQKSYESFQQKQ